MAEEEGLSAYLKKVPAHVPEQGPAGETAKRVESLFNELNLPWTERAGVWEITADVGLVLAGIDEEGGMLTFWQSIHPLGGPPKKKADYLSELLHLNMGTEGACFALS